MRVVKQSVEFITPIDGDVILKRIEECGRVCYKSEDKITDSSAQEFVRNIILRGHESVLEHCSFTVKFITDRAIANEIVRHRIASYSQESTRYCNYFSDRLGSELIFIEPMNYEEAPEFYDRYFGEVQRAYFAILSWNGETPESARAILPLCLKTELVMTSNLREWRHFLKLRTSKAAHPQMRELTLMLLDKLKEKIPVVFDDIEGG